MTTRAPRLDSAFAVERALWRHGAEVHRSMTPVVRTSGGRAPAVAPPSGIADHGDEQQELVARVTWLTVEERSVVHRWYVDRASPAAIAAAAGRSVRHVYRVRARAVARLVAIGDTSEFDDAELAEFA